MQPGPGAFDFQSRALETEHLQQLEGTSPWKGYELMRTPNVKTGIQKGKGAGPQDGASPDKT